MRKDLGDFIQKKTRCEFWQYHGTRVINRDTFNFHSTKTMSHHCFGAGADTFELSAVVSSM